MHLAQSEQSIPNQIINTVQSTLNDSIQSIIDYIPVLILGITVLLLGWLAAKLISWFITRILRGVGFDKVIDEIGLADGLRKANIQKPPSTIIATIAYWTILLNIMLSALKVMKFGEALIPLQNFINKIPAFIAAAIVFVIGMIVSKFFGKIVTASLASIGSDIHKTLGNLVRYFVMTVVTIVALQLIGLPVDLMNQILLAVIVIITAGGSLAFGLGGRQITSNVLAGFYAREMYQVGDRLIIDGEEGILTGLGTVNAEIEINNGRLTIPNTHLTHELVRKIDR